MKQKRTQNLFCNANDMYVNCKPGLVTKYYAKKDHNNEEALCIVVTRQMQTIET